MQFTQPPILWLYHHIHPTSSLEISLSFTSIHFVLWPTEFIHGHWSEHAWLTSGCTPETTPSPPPAAVVHLLLPEWSRAHKPLSYPWLNKYQFSFWGMQLYLLWVHDYSGHTVQKTAFHRLASNLLCLKFFLLPSLKIPRVLEQVV